MSGTYFSPTERILSALPHISPDLPREEWKTVGMAIHAELGDDGFTIFDEWSQPGQTYKAADTRDVWKSFKRNGGITIGTLFYLAEKGGWRPDKNIPPPPPSAPDPAKLERERAERVKQERKEASAAGNAGVLWGHASPAKGHAYLEQKGVAMVEGLRVIEAATALDYRCSFGPAITRDSGKLLLIPIQDEAGKLQSMEAINPTGGKGFLAGGKKSGGSFLIAGDESTIYVVEGLATGLSVHQATGAAVYVAFDAGNLKKVAESVRRRHPEAALMIAGDRDESGTGQGKAKGAARAVAATVRLPDFAGIEGREYGDWNDLHQAAGIAAVKAQLSAPAAEEKVVVTNVTTTPASQTFGNFTVDAAGLWYVDPDPNTKPLRVSAPLHVLARIHNRLGGGYLLLVEFKDFRGAVKQVAIPQKMLVTGQAMAELLADEGLEFRNRQKYRALLIDYLEQARPDKFGLAIDRTGWLRADGAAGGAGASWVGYLGYVYGGGEVLLRPGATGLLHWLGNRADPVKHGQRGTLEQWQEHQGAWCVGNPSLLFQVSMAFAAKILHILNLEGGGFHIYGPSGQGKTTGAGVLVSVDGPPDGWHSWENSRFAFGHKFKELNDSAGVFDEIKLADPKEIQHIAYMASNGHDRGRGKANAAGLANEEPWITLILSLGELAFIGYVRGAGERIYQGAETRMIDLPFCEREHGAFDVLHGFGTGAAFADAIKAANAEYYGTAGRAFVQRLMTQWTPAKIVEFYHEIHKDFANQIPADSAPAIHRAAKRFAAVACGGELAIRLGVVPWHEWAAMDAAGVAFEVWRSGRGGVHDRDQLEVLKQIRGWLLAHEEDSFTRACPKCAGSRVPGMIEVGYEKDEERRNYAACAMCGGSTVLLTKTLNKAGWIRRTTPLSPNPGKYCHVYPETFERELCRDHDTKTALELLKKRRILLCDGKRGPFKQKVRPMTGKGQPPESAMDVYVIRLDAPGWDMGADPHAEHPDDEREAA